MIPQKKEIGAGRNLDKGPRQTETKRWGGDVTGTILILPEIHEGPPFPRLSLPS